MCMPIAAAHGRHFPPCCHLVRTVSNQGSICLLLSHRQTVWPHAMQMNSKTNRFLALSAILSAITDSDSIASTVKYHHHCDVTANQLINVETLSVNKAYWKCWTDTDWFCYSCHGKVNRKLWLCLTSKSVLRGFVMTRTCLFYPKINLKWRLQNWWVVEVHYHNIPHYCHSWQPF